MSAAVLVYRGAEGLGNRGSRSEVNEVGNIRGC